MTQHTPGPWFQSGGAVWAELPPPDGVKNICDVVTNPLMPESDTQRANARLIAAAPEMLAILQVLVARHPKDCACLGGCDFRIARVLLAKIEGR